ncbi:TPA: hypothetical protein H1005_03235, partial [archaeon]|nr:hypothetical protein [Candidatus Naiadarchaeales archaeon SRR2090153.bin1042]
VAFYQIPTTAPSEKKISYEQEYLNSRKVYNLYQERGGLKLTLESTGYFNFYSEYWLGGSGTKKVYRIDTIVENIAKDGKERTYIFGDAALIVDGKQYQLSSDEATNPIYEGASKKITFYTEHPIYQSRAADTPQNINGKTIRFVPGDAQVTGEDIYDYSREKFKEFEFVG